MRSVCPYNFQTPLKILQDLQVCLLHGTSAAFANPDNKPAPEGNDQQKYILHTQQREVLQHCVYCLIWCRANLTWILEIPEKSTWSIFNTRLRIILIGSAGKEKNDPTNVKWVKHRQKTATVFVFVWEKWTVCKFKWQRQKTNASKFMQSPWSIVTHIWACLQAWYANSWSRYTSSQPASIYKHKIKFTA